MTLRASWGNKRGQGCVVVERERADRLSARWEVGSDECQEVMAERNGRGEYNTEPYFGPLVYSPEKSAI